MQNRIRYLIILYAFPLIVYMEVRPNLSAKALIIHKFGM